MTETATIAQDGGTECERQCDLKRQLLAHVVQSLNPAATRSASDALSELLCDAHEEMAKELLAPIFDWSDFWPQQIAAELLGLPDDEYTSEELLKEFEKRELADSQNKPANWSQEGF